MVAAVSIAMIVGVEADHIVDHREVHVARPVPEVHLGVDLGVVRVVAQKAALEVNLEDAVKHAPEPQILKRRKRM